MSSRQPSPARPDAPTGLPDLDRFRAVPEIEALRPLRKPGRGESFREGWTPLRTLLVVALAPLAFWVYADITAGLATSSALWVALTSLLALGASFVVTTYLPGGPKYAGGTCAAGPVIGLFLSGWLVHNNPTPLGAALALVLVTVAGVQRVTRTSC